MQHSVHSNHPGLILGSLAILTLVSLAAGSLPLPGAQVNLILLAIALLMTALVVVQYMGLTGEPHLVWWIVGVPLFLFILILLVLVPDMVLRLNQPPP